MLHALAQASLCTPSTPSTSPLVMTFNGCCCCCCFTVRIGEPAYRHAYLSMPIYINGKTRSYPGCQTDCPESTHFHLQCCDVAVSLPSWAWDVMNDDCVVQGHAPQQLENQALEKIAPLRSLSRLLTCFHMLHIVGETAWGLRDFPEDGNLNGALAVPFKKWEALACFLLGARTSSRRRVASLCWTWMTERTSWGRSPLAKRHSRKIFITTTLLWIK